MKENLYTPDKIRTVSGNYIDIFNPDPAAITIEDIAHGLAFTCRFNAQLPIFFSVAQHSYNCVVNLQKPATDMLKLSALMHDAAEAYMLDMGKPNKRRFPDYEKVEDDLMHVIARKFGFFWPKPIEVQRVDKEMMEWEWNNIFIAPFCRAKVLSMCDARELFLNTFKILAQ